jgi:methylase of polypeptide subunit release factors
LLGELTSKAYQENRRNGFLKQYLFVEEVDAGELSNIILKHASESKNEEDLKIRVETSLRPFLEKWGIQWASYEHRHEISGEKKDALYGRVILEYKTPGRLDNKTEFKKVKEQVRDYIRHEAHKEENFGKYLGIILDGFKISFIRYTKGRWDEQDDPLPVNAQTVLKMLQSLRALARKPLDVEFLLTDFGPRSEISRKAISAFYFSLVGKTKPRSEMLFNDWKRVFSQANSFPAEKLPKLINYYGLSDHEKVNVEKLLFATHTYYTVLMKLLTSEIVTLFADSLLGSYLKRVQEAYYRSPKEMQLELTELEEGGIFTTIGIKNFLEADYFAWYLDEWNNEIAKSIADITEKLQTFEPATVELTPERVKDLFKRLYQNLVPRDIRHSLGEYFTPDWLAELLLDESGYDGDPTKRILDPACGSGTFLVMIIKRIREYASANLVDERSLLLQVISNVRGIDLNPLAVLASKANYLIALADLLRYRPREGIEIPIYLADSISIERGQKWETLTSQGEQEYRLYTAEGEFWIPYEVVDKGALHEILACIDAGVKMEMTENQFISFLDKALKKELNLSKISVGRIVRLYKKIYDLEYRYHKDRIWTQLLKNSFAPLLIGRFDFIVGNPPWINWEYLPEFYRNITRNLWDKYGLLGKTKGMGLGKVKRDISMLFVARCFDQYIKPNGKLAFLIPLTTFKTQAGGGFRNWLANNCEVKRIHDLVELYPFEGSTTRTSMLLIGEGKTSFPCKCLMWSNPKSVGMDMETDLREVKRETSQFEMIATPIQSGKPESSWLITLEKAYSAIRKVTGESEYEAHMGIKTALNGAYWISILGKGPNGLIINNLSMPGQKKAVREVKKVVEPDFIYPFARGRDLKRWFIDQESSNLMIAPHLLSSGKPIEESELKVNYPQTYGYLHSLKADLSGRSIHKLWGKGNPFYSLYNIGEYSFSTYKVAWKEIAGQISGKATSFASAIIEPRMVSFSDKPKTVLPDNKLITISTNDRDEAHFICAVLNSTPVLTTIASYAFETAMDTHIIKNVKVAKFNSKKEIHLALARLSQLAHQLSKKYYLTQDESLLKQVNDVEDQIDNLVAELYGISNQELSAMRQSLSILKSEEQAEPNDKQDLQDDLE